jgi:hypothetical protein
MHGLRKDYSVELEHSSSDSKSNLRSVQLGSSPKVSLCHPQFSLGVQILWPGLLVLGLQTEGFYVILTCFGTTVTSVNIVFQYDQRKKNKMG